MKKKREEHRVIRIVFLTMCGSLNTCVIQINLFQIVLIKNMTEFQ